MAVFAVNRRTMEEADTIRKHMMQAAIDMAAGRSTQMEFDRAWTGFNLCYEAYAYQPMGDHAEWLSERLKDFYPVEVEESGKIVRVDYRHESLPKREAVAVPDLAGRWPKEVTLEDVSEDSGLLDAIGPRFLSGISEGPFHLTIGWEAK